MEADVIRERLAERFPGAEIVLADLTGTRSLKLQDHFGPL